MTVTQAHMAALRAHEWATKEDLRTVYCETCGAQSRGKAPSHRRGCAYKELMALCQEMAGVAGVRADLFIIDEAGKP